MTDDSLEMPRLTFSEKKINKIDFRKSSITKLPRNKKMGHLCNKYPGQPASLHNLIRTYAYHSMLDRKCPENNNK